MFRLLPLINAVRLSVLDLHSSGSVSLIINSFRVRDVYQELVEIQSELKISFVIRKQYWLNSFVCLCMEDRKGEWFVRACSCETFKDNLRLKYRATCWETDLWRTQSSSFASVWIVDLLHVRELCCDSSSKIKPTRWNNSNKYSKGLWVVNKWLLSSDSQQLLMHVKLSCTELNLD